MWDPGEGRPVWDWGREKRNSQSGLKVVVMVNLTVSWTEPRITIESLSMGFPRSCWLGACLSGVAPSLLVWRKPARECMALSLALGPDLYTVREREPDTGECE